MPNDAGPLEGFGLCWRIYSLPGGIAFDVHREEVIRDTDGLVFVIDARADRKQANLDQLLALETLLNGIGYQLSELPVVLQVNHTDADDALPIADVLFDLNPFEFDVIESVAKDAVGVAETHARIARTLLGRIEATLAGSDTLRVTAVHAERQTDTDVIRQHVDNIQDNATSVPRPTVNEIQSDAGLPPTHDHQNSVEVAFQPRAFVGSHPVAVTSASMKGDMVLVELEMERMGGGERRQLTVLLANRPTDTPPVPRVAPPAKASAAPTGDRVFDYLPNESSVDLHRGPDDLPALWYGVMGVAGGIVIGLLAGYLLGIVL